MRNKNFCIFIGNFQIFKIIFFSFFVLASCKDVQNPIPVKRVYLRLDLTFEDKALKAIPSYKTFKINDINLAQGESAGYGGVLVVHTMLNAYRAFDLACPYEVKSNVTISVDKEVLNAVCPVCGTKYDVGFGTGAPSGTSKYYLRIYNTSLNGDKLIVTN